MNQGQIKLLGIASQALADQCKAASEPGVDVSSVIDVLRDGYLQTTRAGNGLRRKRGPRKVATAARTR